MDKWSKAFLAGTASGVWFIAFFAGMAWMRFTGVNSAAFPSVFEALIFLAIPFAMALVYGIFAIGFLNEAGKAERNQRMDKKIDVIPVRAN